MRIAPQEAGELVRRAAGGDHVAWTGLVDAYGGLVAYVVRGHRLDNRDSGDVIQTTWLRLVEHIGRLQDPDRVGAWLVTTARRESLRVKSRSARTLLVGDQADLERRGDAGGQAGVDADLLREEQEQAVQVALGLLPEPHQRLMRMLMLDPAPSYEEISAALSIPVGSIGPTRMRCLAKLRRSMGEGGIQVSA